MTNELFGEVISSYSRAQAIEDGVLVDVSSVAREAGINFPIALTDKYQPRKIEDFIGLEGLKRLFANLLKAPRPVGILLVGPLGSGKPSMPMAFAEQLPGTLHHISSQKCDVSALDRLNETLCYCPAHGRFHVVKVDEADQMTDKAQLQLLSRLDGTASLKPKFGSGWERGTPLPVMWIFTCNGRGEQGTTSPSTFEPRFLSRCLVVACGKPEVAEIGGFLRRIWSLEGGNPSDDPSHPLPKAARASGTRSPNSKSPSARASCRHDPSRESLGSSEWTAWGEFATSRPASLSPTRENGNFAS